MFQIFKFHKYGISSSFKIENKKKLQFAINKSQFQ